jgi:pimeloyl-ACP methyl ester carboxylesterase
MSVRTLALAAAFIVVTGMAVAAAPALAQPAAVAADPNRLFADSKLIVKDRISVEVVGHGPDLVFVPGLSSSRETWRRTAERLRGHYRLHLVQVAGFAGEPARANATAPVFQPTAEAIDAYLVEAHLTPATYIGHSLGGTMGLYLAEHHPEHLKKVLMVDSLPFYGVLMGGPDTTPEKLKPMAEGARYAMAHATPEQTAANSDTIIGSMVNDPEGKRLAIGWGKASDRTVVANAMVEDMLLDLRPGLPAIRTPMTLVYPFDAAMGMPLERWDGLYHGQYAPLPGVTLVRVDASKHFVMFDQPAKFDAALDAFLAK